MNVLLGAQHIAKYFVIGEDQRVWALDDIGLSAPRVAEVQHLEAIL